MKSLSRISHYEVHRASQPKDKWHFMIEKPTKSEAIGWATGATRYGGNGFRYRVVEVSKKTIFEVE